MKIKTKTLFLFLLAFVLLFLVFKSSKTRLNISFHLDQSYSSPSLPNNKWIINGIVTQYSSVITETNTNIYKLESLILINHKLRKIKLDKLFCVLRVGDLIHFLSTTQILDIPLMETKHGVNSIWRVSCELEGLFILSQDISVAIIDKRDFIDIISKIDKISFQKVNFYKILEKKKQEIVNCVHMVRDLNEHKFQKLQNWISIQKEIGFNQIKIYTHYISQEILNILKNKFKDFLQIIEYKTKYEDICGQDLDNFKKYYCNKSMEIFFEISDDSIFNIHERMSSNDCLMNYKHKYQYVSNYDFDEFIFPRQLDTKYPENIINPNLTCSNHLSILNKIEIKYNIIDFINKLNRIYGQNIAYYKFENVLFLNDYNILLNQIKKIENNIKKSKKYFINYKQITFEIKTEKDLNYLNYFKKYENYIQCLNNSISNNSKINFKFCNPYSILFNIREGKSIYNTDFIEAYNQHFANRFKSFFDRFKSVKVPLNIGYVSHFRDGDLDYKVQYPFKYIFFDIEYFNFLYKFNLKY